MDFQEANVPLISIIIPVYNTEKYLIQCLNSVLDQGYRDNIEIILIDDGSIDNSGRICDEFAERDSRIKVFHTINCGLSAARNKGVTVAQGKWIAFLDSDDWLAENYLMVLSGIIRSYEADYISFGYFEEYQNKTIKKRICAVPEIDVTKESYILKTNYNNSVWNKIYKAELFAGISFPVEQNYEDVSISFQILERCNKLVCIPDLLIHYRKRQSSIITSYRLKDLVDCWDANYERFIKYSNNGAGYRYVTIKSSIVAAASIWCWTGKYGSHEREPFSNRYKEIGEFRHANIKQVLLRKEYNAFYKLLIIITKPTNDFGFKILYFLNCAFRKIRNRELYQ